MSDLERDYPLSVFREAVSGVVGKALLFVGCLVLATLAGSAIAFAHGDHIHPVGALMLYPLMVIGGFVEIWGIPIYATLLILFLIYVARDISHWWLIVVFTLQSFEAWRWCASWVVGKP
jgi:hypothetical protein